MKRMVQRAVAVVAAITMLSALGACGGGQSANGSDEDAINVVASVNQWGTVAKALGGGNVNVTSIINSTNVEAHDYEPTTADIAKLQKAQVIVVNGADYDSWAVKAAKSTKANIVNAAEVSGKKSCMSNGSPRRTISPRASPRSRKPLMG